MYRVLHTTQYDKDFLQLDGSYRSIVAKFKQRLKETPYVGQILTYSFFREKKIDDLRIFYLIYDDMQKILLVKITNKRAQQHHINFVKEHLREYEEYTRRY